MDRSLGRCHFYVFSTTSPTSQWRHLFLALKIALFSFPSKALITVDLFTKSFGLWNSKFPVQVGLNFTFIYCWITLTFLSTPENFLVFFTVAMLSRYQSPVNCRSRNLQENCSTTWITVTTVIFQTWNFCSYLRGQRTCPLKDEGVAELGNIKIS